MSQKGLRSRTKTSPARIGRCKHATMVMKLRLEGLTHREIGNRMGFSEVRAFRICQEELDRLNAIRAETADQLQRLEVSRLDMLLRAVWAKAKEGDFRAIDRVLSIMERRAKLLGLDLADKDAPPGGNVTLNVTEVLVNKREDITNGDGEAASGPAALPAK
jgi:hypothetical protein